MGLNLEYSKGQTPIEDDEKEELLVSTIATRTELDEFEQLNIEQAILWTLKRPFNSQRLLSEQVIRTVHKKMFGDVWAWAEQFRTTNKNIGVDKWRIPVDLRSLLDDTRFWIDNKSYSPDEIAVRFKHRIVSIHCFPNGNGRHSRLMADIIAQKLFKQPVFSWGAINYNRSEARMEYLKSLKEADNGRIDALVIFARS